MKLRVNLGFVGLLQLVFITLKLTNTIDWTWVWVLSPLWIWASLVVGIFAIAILFIVIGVAAGSKIKIGKKRN